MQLGLDPLDPVVLDLLGDELQLLDLPGRDEGGDAVGEGGDADVLAGHVGHLGQVRVVAADLLVLVDVLLQLVLGNGWLLLADDVHQQSLLVLPGLVLLCVMRPPLHVGRVLLFELAARLGSEDRHCFPLLLLPQLHRLPSLHVLDELAHAVLRRQPRAFLDSPE